jgi:cytochrome b translational activator protein CBS2, mitochondrial
VARRGHSSDQTIVAAAESTPEAEAHQDTRELPDKGRHDPFSNRPHLRKLLDEVSEQSLDEINSIADREQTPIGLSSSISLRVPRQLPQREECKRIHVLGYDPRAYYIAHELAGNPHLDPVKLLVHKKNVMRSWKLEGEQVSVWKGIERSSRGRGRAEAEWIGRGRTEPSNEHIDQLIVTLACGVTKNALENIIHRIDSRTTLCLVQDGLGVVEHLNATLFQDPTARPHYVLGHMAASLGYNKKWFFGAKVREQGKLYLHAVERGLGLERLFKFHPPVERRSHATQFLRTLVTTPGLHAGGYDLENWLIKKLPALVFNCVIEPMAVILDTTYDTLPRNEHAIRLADELLDELYNVIMALPELTNSAKVIKHCGLDQLRKKTIRRIWEKGSMQSNMLSRVRAGQWVDIDYMNGYFIRRARELGIKVPQNEMVVDIVKARIAERREEMSNTIPFEDGTVADEYAL